MVAGYTDQQVLFLQVEGLMCFVDSKKPLNNVLTDPAHLEAKDFRAGSGSMTVMTVTLLNVNPSKKKTLPANTVKYNLSKVKRLLELNLASVV